MQVPLDAVEREEGWVKGEQRGAAPGVAQAVAGGEVDEEGVHWQRFALLREWVRLGLPARDGIR